MTCLFIAIGGHRAEIITPINCQTNTFKAHHSAANYIKNKVLSVTQSGCYCKYLI